MNQTKNNDELPYKEEHFDGIEKRIIDAQGTVSYTHLRAHET